ncbi:MAG: glycoside hydrolase family 3 C-terminal domain-containing protein [Lachnospiraceae bacterium]|nr:glycoside hydrolase family 3 C-terminal domain-containing protein [Lachnospiraceae bacterium]
MSHFSSFLYLPVKPLGKNNTPITGCKEHIELSLEAACEGMVLLKNDKVLPFEKGTKLSVFGKAQFDYVTGGGGSGAVNTAYVRNIYDGFKLLEKEGNVSVYEPVSAFFKGVIEKSKEKQESLYGGAVHVAEEGLLTDKLVKTASKESDAALICFARYSWEGGDKQSVKGDYYLSEEEEKMVSLVTKYFKKVVVSLNVGCVIDTEWFAHNRKIQGALLSLQGGMEGGLAIAKTLCGLVNPSGKLVDTLAKSYDDYPSAKNFLESEKFVNYEEDIFVGYRYFESFKEVKNRVNYPFGYGLSYTTFQISEVDTKKTEDGKIVSYVSVKNTGNVAGKEVVELYVEKPQGMLPNPSRILVAFAKTKLLMPGEETVLLLEGSLRDLASFDDLGKLKKSALVIEKGNYVFHIGNSVRNTKKSKFVLKVSEDEVYEQLHSYLKPHHLKKRMVGFDKYEELETDNYEVLEGDTIYHGWTCPVHGVLTLNNDKVKNNAFGTIEAQKNVDGIPNFIKVAEGKQTVDEFMDELPVEELIEMLGGQPNSGVSNTFCFGNFIEHRIPNVPTADGPQGLRLNEDTGIPTTAWPTATSLATTWNTEICYKVAKAGGMEVKENHIGIWLTPAMNIHRNPLCGRNFEYYSEDPVVAGKIASAVIQGMQSVKVAASMKHFAFNDKEWDRMVSDSRVSERAAREVYLRGFEIAVKEGKPFTVMSSYNRVNGCYTSQNKDLLTGILREEWGFDGVVTTDWMNRAGQVKELLAGNDIKMPIGEPFVLLEAYNKGEITLEDIKRSVKRILELFLKIDD